MLFLTGVPREKPLEVKGRTNKKQTQPTYCVDAGIFNPEPHWWETIALRAPTLQRPCSAIFVTSGNLLVPLHALKTIFCLWVPLSFENNNKILLKNY